jgi:thiol-disulfide isomerase/thioredoxin
MENNKKYIALALRVIVAFLFIISAVAKMYPSPYFAISTFEVKSLYPMGFSEGFSVYFSRTLIGIEFALGLLLLQPHYLKKLVIPATILMLVVFIIHLSIDTIANGGNSGNCGCFGSLLPMTPIEAIIKNVVAVGLLVWLLKLLPTGFDRHNFYVTTTILLASILMVYMVAPIAPRVTEVSATATEPFPIENNITTQMPAADTVPAASNEAQLTYEAPAKETATETAAPKLDEPKQVKSVYSQYFANADKGKKIIALFAPGCEHCRATAKELTELKAKDKTFPDVSVIFMDEEADLIPEFFKFAGKDYPYKVMDIISFWKFLGNGKDTPSVIYLWNGNKIKEWDGINEKKFVSGELVKLLKKPYSEIKK